MIGLLTWSSFTGLKLQTNKEYYILFIGKFICIMLIHLTNHQSVTRSIEKLIFLQKNSQSFDPIM